MTLPRSTGAVQGNDPHTVPSNQFFRSIRKLANTLAAYQAIPSDELILADTSAGNNPNISLPASPDDGDQYVVCDGSGTAATTPVTIAATGGKTIQGAASINLNQNNGQVQFSFSKTLNQWLAALSVAAVTGLIQPSTDYIIDSTVAVANKNVYPTLAAAVDARNAAGVVGTARYLFRGDFQTIAARVYILGDDPIEFVGQHGATAAFDCTELRVTTGATFVGTTTSSVKGGITFDSLTVVWAGATTPFVVGTSAGQGPIVWKNGTSLFDVGATAPFVSARNTATFVPMFIEHGNNQGFFVTAVTAFESRGAGATLLIDISDSFQLPASILADAAGGTTLVHVSSSAAQVNVTQAALTGGALVSGTNYVLIANQDMTVGQIAVAIADAAATTITRTQGAFRRLAGLSQNTVVTLSNTGANGGAFANGNDLLRVVNETAAAFTLRFNRADGTALATVPVATRCAFTFEFDGANWHVREGGTWV